MEFEQLRKPLAKTGVFYHRLLISSLIGVALIAISLAVGMLGYHAFEGLGWLDAFENAAMILSGMGPVDTMRTTGGKLFAGFYAIYSGIALISIAGVMLAPVVHRFLHRLHLEK